MIKGNAKPPSLAAHLRGQLAAPRAADAPGRVRVERLPEAIRRKLGDRPAAVLIPVMEHGSDTSLIFTRRTHTLAAHPGQVSFPGGGTEAGDADAAATALREAHEEIGIEPASVEIVGHLDVYPTTTGFAVTPVVGVLGERVDYRIDPIEVAEVFEVPLDYLLDPANYQIEGRDFGGVNVRYFVVRHGEHRIWGATAGMLVDFAARLGLDVERIPGFR